MTASTAAPRADIARAGRPTTLSDRPETTMTDRNRSRTIVCASCGTTAANRGYGYCNNCYARWLRWGRPVDGPPPPRVRKPRPKAAPRKPADPEARFWSKVAKTDDCWLWKAGTHRNGYGLFSVGKKVIYAHRFAYELLVGAIPGGLVLDHECHNRAADCAGGDGCPHRRCVNPAHLKAATLRENSLSGKSAWAVNARKTHCPQGHPYSEANTIVNRVGQRSVRVCRSCMTARSKSGGTMRRPEARTHCPQGHPYSDENTYRPPGGGRKCRTCRQAKDQSRAKERTARRNKSA
ncbi:HNH endonuclease signature motif containing protein [Streptomyces sp. NPDC005732]|uniref:HNH endonuclease signature motif containing protein n=1 Tax=Streptomyces sp. NPDC005732 TaxID=3157057 RepID=UPI0033D5CBEA